MRGEEERGGEGQARKEGKGREEKKMQQADT